MVPDQAGVERPGLSVWAFSGLVFRVWGLGLLRTRLNKGTLVNPTPQIEAISPFIGLE